MATAPLTNAAIQNLKASKDGKPVQRPDSRGLYIEATPTGSRLWRLRYRYKGKDCRMSLGAYPEVPLAGRKDPKTGLWIPGAREKRDHARQLLAAGHDPAKHRDTLDQQSAERARNTFEVVAREWLGIIGKDWAARHTDRVRSRLGLGRPRVREGREANFLKQIHERPIAEITPPELLRVVQQIEQRGKRETARRVLSSCGQVFRYAVSAGLAPLDITVSLRGTIKKPKEKSHAAVTDPKRFGVLLRLLGSYTGTLTVQSALRLAPLLWVRPGELRHAKWSEMDLDAAEWRFTLSKEGGDHIVPLPTQAVEILRLLQRTAHRSEYVFPGGRSAERPMSENAVLLALRKLGIEKSEMSGHGFRATARTIGDEVLGFRMDFIEHQLGHQVKDPNGRAYNRTSFLPQRRVMLQQWADYLDGLRAAAVAEAAEGAASDAE